MNAPLAPELTADELWNQHFRALYPADARADLERARQEDANPSGNANILSHLDDAAARFVAMSKVLFARDLGLDYSDASVHRLSAAITKEVRDAWASEVVPSGAAPEAGVPNPSTLFQAVVHGSAYVGACIVRNHGGAWRVRRPLWESLVALSSPRGDGLLPVFHWWLRSLSDAELGTYSLADRYRAYVESPHRKREDMPVVFEGADARTLPRVQKVRYDIFYKYLKAHLPELKDVGKDFPTPERFEAYGFSWLQPMFLGGGRMLLLYGRGDKGLHLFWLGKDGFEASLYVACDKFPDPRVIVSGDKLQIHFAHGEKPQCHEVLWWGP
ncbi:MAG: hypothetical protein U0174_16545 [Polyangiaceae bacterium]